MRSVVRAHPGSPVNIARKMDLKVTVIKNTFFQVLSRFATSVSALVVSALIARFLGVELYGRYSIVLTYITAFFLLADFGINAIVLKRLDYSEEAKIDFKRVLILKVLFGIFGTLLSLALLPLFNYSPEVKAAILVASPVILFTSVTSAATIVFQAKLKYSRLSVATIASSVVVLIGFYAYLALGNDDLLGLTRIYLITSFLLPVLAVILALKDISMGGAWLDIPYMKDTLKQAVPFGLVLVINTAMVQADRFVISVYSPVESMAYYTTAYRLFDLVLVAPTFFMNALYPSLIKSYSEDFVYFEKIMAKSLNYLFVAGLIASAFTFLLSEWFIVLVWGTEMANASIALNILMAGAAIFFLTSPLSWALLIKGYEKSMLVVYVVGFLINLVANLLFIPKYDYVAAAVTTVTTEVFILGALYYLYYTSNKVIQSSQS